MELDYMDINTAAKYIGHAWKDLTFVEQQDFMAKYGIEEYPEYPSPLPMLDVVSTPLIIEGTVDESGVVHIDDDSCFYANEHTLTEWYGSEWTDVDIDMAYVAYAKISDGVVEYDAARDFTYEVDFDGRAVVTSFCNDNRESLSVPAMLDDHIVKAIGAEAFSYCDRLKHITVPRTVTEIKEGAFEYCHKLETISIPRSVKSIQANAFYGCDRLKSISYSGSQAEWDAVKKSDTALGDVGIAFEKDGEPAKKEYGETEAASVEELPKEKPQSAGSDKTDVEADAYLKG